VGTEVKKRKKNEGSRSYSLYFKRIPENLERRKEREKEIKR
jgi:hypothetical protein